MSAAVQALVQDGLTWLIVGAAALYVARAGWRRAKALLASSTPAAREGGIPGPMGSTLARPGSPSTGCDGCSGGCGKSSGAC